MELERIVLRRVRLPLATPFRAAWGTETERDLLLVEVRGPRGHGWGECAAMTAPLYTSEYVDAAHAVIKAHLIPRLGTEVAADEVEARLAPVKGHHMAKAALEMAVLDADLRADGLSLAARLGVERLRVPCGVAVGLAGSVAELLDAVSAAIDQGYSRVKLKIEPGWDHQPVAAVRDRFGPDLWLQVDANGSYRLDDWPRLAGLDPYGLLCIEQPLPDDDLAGHAELARRIATPICLDESITSYPVALDALSRGACSVVCIKPARVGGYLPARRIHDLCLDRGVAAWCGGMHESGLARSANLALAALPGFTMPGEVGPPGAYLVRDIVEPLKMSGGYLDVPTGPGVGPEPLAEALEELTWFSEEIPVD